MRSSRYANESISSLTGCAAFISTSGLRVGCFRGCNQGGKSGFVGRRQVRQNLAVQFDSGFLETANELAVRDVGRPAGRADADNPQRPEVPLLAPAPDKSVAQRLLYRFLRRAVQL